jgi:hypothetical protein
VIHVYAAAQEHQGQHVCLARLRRHKQGRLVRFQQAGVHVDAVADQVIDNLQVGAVFVIGVAADKAADFVRLAQSHLLAVLLDGDGEIERAAARRQKPRQTSH